ncbi:MAG: phosphate/phosphite/phosphonate ABC transporter substrate-binding protein [Magnetospirillum sp.]|nr:phosphate/phosphite/phosphonate ABC transporter substrate-binding protein [Magnetospirillum sp.]
MRTPIALGTIVATFLALSSAFAAETISVGVVPQFDLRRINSVWRPLLDGLERQTGLTFRLDVPPSIPAFEKSLMAGEYDLAYMNPYHYVVASKRQGYVPLIRDFGGDLSGIIVVAKDSPLTGVEQLNGKVVAFPSPNAMGAALVPRAEFARKYHIAVTEKYVKSHSSAYLAVILGEADAAGGIAATLELFPAESRQKLRILYQTESFPPHPLTAHPRLSKAQRDTIVQAFLALAGTPEGKNSVAEIPMRDPRPASAADYAGLDKLGLQDFYVEEE